MVDILTALQSGKPAFTKSGYKVKFIALLQTKCPAPLVVSVLGKFENYYIDGRFHSPHDSNMDIVLSDFYL